MVAARPKAGRVATPAAGWGAGVEFLPGKEGLYDWLPLLTEGEVVFSASFALRSFSGADSDRLAALLPPPVRTGIALRRILPQEVLRHIVVVNDDGWATPLVLLGLPEEAETARAALRALLE